MSALPQHSTREIVLDATGNAYQPTGPRRFGHNPSWVKAADVAQLEQENTTLAGQNSALAASGLELAAQLSFVVGTDTPDTQRKARAVLVQRLTDLEAENAELRQALDALVAEMEESAEVDTDDGNYQAASATETFAEKLKGILASPSAPEEAK